MDGQKEFCDVIIDYKRIALDFEKFEKELLSVVKGLVEHVEHFVDKLREDTMKKF